MIRKVEEELERNAIDEERHAKYIGESEAINKELDRLEQFNIKVDVAGFIKHKHMFFIYCFSGKLFMVNQSMFDILKSRDWIDEDNYVERDPELFSYLIMHHNK